MEKLLSVTAALLAALVLGSCATAGGGLTASPVKKIEAPSVSGAGSGGKSFHLMRMEQLRGIPAGSSIGVISGGGTLPLYIEADLEAKGFVVRQIDIYNLIPARQRIMTDPSDDYIFINTLVESLKKLDKEALNKESMAGAIDKLLPTDHIYVENQLVDNYLSLLLDLKKLVSSLNVDFLVLSGPAYQELSYAMKIYDSNKFDLIFTCLFAGDKKEWRAVVGVPQKSPNLSFNFELGNEPSAFWEMAFSRYATDKIKIGSANAGSSSK